MVPRQPARGFTLIEVLVAMTIMSLIALMSWQGVDGIVRSRNISQGRLEKLLRLNTVLAQWEQDLQAVQDTSRVPALRFNGASLTLTRRAANGIQLVVWARHGTTWERWAGPPVTTARALQDQWQASQQFLGNEVGQLKVASNVAEWQLYYYVDNAWANAQSSTSSLPSGVRLVLTLAGGDGLNGRVTRDVSLGPKPQSP